MKRSTTHASLTLAICLATLSIGCAPRDSVEAARSCDALASEGKHEEASRCLFELVNEPARATRPSTYELWDDEAGVVITRGAQAQVIDGATMREKMIAQIPMMEATGMNDTFEDVAYYTTEELGEIEGVPPEIVSAIEGYGQEVVFITCTRVSGRDGARRPFGLGMTDVDGKWRIVGHFMEVR